MIKGFHGPRFEMYGLGGLTAVEVKFATSLTLSEAVYQQKTVKSW